MDIRNLKNMLLVINPKAGKCAAKSKLFDIVNIFSKAGFRVTVYPTKKDGTSYYLSEHAAKYDIIVCCGGDGTLSEVISGVFTAGCNTPIGYIPMGSTNDLASNMGIPRNYKLAALSIINGTIMEYDLGTINGRPFSYISAVGAFTKASYSAPQKLKNKLGHFAYILEGAKCLTQIKPFEAKIDYGKKEVKGNFIYISVSNTTSVAGLVKLDKDLVDFSDGAFELLMVKKPTSLADGIELISDFLSNKLKCRYIQLRHASAVRLSFTVPMYFSIDGEKSQPLSDVVIKNHKKAVKLVVPRKIRFH